MLFVVAVLVAVFWVEGILGWVLVGVAAVVEIGESFAWYWWSRRRRARVGVEALVGREAVVVLPCRPEGQVRIDGELWRARCDAGADAGDRVSIRGIEGLTLLVGPAD